MDIVKSSKFDLHSLPPMHAWPLALKRVVRLAAAGLCLAAYILLLGGILGLLVMLALP
jgi:hypothetical protein